MESGLGQATALRFGKIAGLGARLKKALGSAQTFLFAKQHEDGWWCGELEADTTLESDYIFLHTVLGTRDERRFQQCAAEILRHQNADGGWPICYGGPSNVSASVKAYFALKMCGYLPEDERMERARVASWRWAECRPAIPSARSICAGWASTTTTRYRRFRRRSCCFPTGSGSISTRFRRGRGRF